jgi:hypothetical protein
MFNGAKVFNQLIGGRFFSRRHDFRSRELLRLQPEFERLEHGFGD